MSKILVQQSQSPPPYGPSESKCLGSFDNGDWVNEPAEGQETANEDIMKDVSILILDLLYIGPTFPLLGNLLHHLVPHSSLVRPINQPICLLVWPCLKFAWWLWMVGCRSSINVLIGVGHVFLDFLQLCVKRFQFRQIGFGKRQMKRDILRTGDKRRD